MILASRGLDCGGVNCGAFDVLCASAGERYLAQTSYIDLERLPLLSLMIPAMMVDDLALGLSGAHKTALTVTFALRQVLQRTCVSHLA